MNKKYFVCLKISFEQKHIIEARSDAEAKKKAAKIRPYGPTTEGYIPNSELWEVQEIGKGTELNTNQIFSEIHAGLNNSRMKCPDCDERNVNYSIRNGDFVYTCLECDNEIDI
jgi:hypothetical protein